VSFKRVRLAGRIRIILSELLLRDVADPSLYNITITEVELDTELQYAKVFVNAFGDESREAEIMLGLERAKGFLRREVATRVRMRKAPELVFVWDKRLQRVERINEILSGLDIPPAPPEEPETLEDDDYDYDDDDE
jgi:ribosome-binding factor A